MKDGQMIERKYNGNYCNDVKPNEHHQSVLSHSENYNLETSVDNE
ncbi:15613_t:CDS:2 [Entrophospora sp. SA101]|nr:15613_t:CDS:2 [Entrophospora sp. SA101]